MARDGRKAPSPATELELMERARALTGMTVGELEIRTGFSIEGEALRTKGKVGELVERALGATGGSAAVHDFPHLGIELKTVPVDGRGKPQESTYVCRLSLNDAEYAEWETSWVRAKLSRVLLIPVVEATANAETRTFGAAVLWSPTAAQEATLRHDFDELVGMIAIGGIERVTAHLGRVLQIRPKAAHGRVRTQTFSPEGDAIDTIPRGFYLRAKFTEAILANPLVDPDSFL